jgi:kynurenine formamidase
MAVVSSSAELLDLLRAARAYDLAQPYFTGMPHFPTHPPFLFSLTKLHGDYVGPDQVSSASEAFSMGGHVGTHIDALCHFSRGGLLRGDVEAATVESCAEGVKHLSIDGVGLLLARGVLLDVAAVEGVDALPAGFTVTPDHLGLASEGTQILPGDVVLIRTGWGALWNDARRYTNQAHCPGPALEGARWLSERRILAAGSDTMALERIPDPAMPAHVHLLVESGVHILESLYLEELARDRVSTFVFVAAPLKIRGATGSPVRPFALV